LNDRIGRRMKLQDLHVLMTVVQAGSMGKAAQRLNTSQPAISRSIAELEHELGVRLLDRHRQGIAPTEYGRALRDCGVAVFDDLRRGIKNIEAIADLRPVKFTLGQRPGWPRPSLLQSSIGSPDAAARPFPCSSPSETRCADSAGPRLRMGVPCCCSSEPRPVGCRTEADKLTSVGRSRIVDAGYGMQ
jgi:molybdenum-dependent DNA-binding transcriptional regulator ModE